MEHVLKLEADQQPPAGYIVREVTQDAKNGPRAGRYAVLPRTGCATCHGTGFTTYIVTMATERPGDDGTVVKVDELQRVNRYCGCVDRRLINATLRGGSVALAATPERSLEIAAERAAARKERLQAEVKAAQEALDSCVQARERAVAPYLAAVAFEEVSHKTAQAGVAMATAERLEAETALATAEATLAAARDTAQKARQRAVDAGLAMAGANLALEAATAALRAASEAASKAGNAGHRHRCLIAQKRLDTLTERLARLGNGGE